jgi:hypothetical protein
VVDLSGSPKLTSFHSNAFCAHSSADRDRAQLNELRLNDCALAGLSYGILREADWQRVQKLRLDGNPFDGTGCTGTGLGVQWSLASSTGRLPDALKDVGNMT